MFPRVFATSVENSFAMSPLSIAKTNIIRLQKNILANMADGSLKNIGEVKRDAIEMHSKTERTKKLIFSLMMLWYFKKMSHKTIPDAKSKKRNIGNEQTKTLYTMSCMFRMFLRYTPDFKLMKTLSAFTNIKRMNMLHLDFILLYVQIKKTRSE